MDRLNGGYGAYPRGFLRILSGFPKSTERPCGA